MPQRFYVTQQGSGGDRHIYAGRTRFIGEAMVDKFEQVTWPAVAAGSAYAAKPAAPVLQVRDRARAAWK